MKDERTIALINEFILLIILKIENIFRVLLKQEHEPACKAGGCFHAISNSLKFCECFYRVYKKKRISPIKCKFQDEYGRYVFMFVFIRKPVLSAL